jgi:hypothetical protein
MTKQEQINEIIKNFDWDRTRKAMEALNWTWAFSDGAPTTGELVVEATRQLSRAWDERHNRGLPSFRIASGGFEAICSICDDEACLELKFVLTEWDTYNG